MQLKRLWQARRVFYPLWKSVEGKCGMTEDESDGTKPGHAFRLRRVCAICQRHDNTTRPLRSARMASSPVSIDRIFASVRVMIDDREHLLQKLSALEARLRERPDLFDADDLGVVTSRRAALQTSYDTMMDEFQAALELYKRTIADLKVQIAQRESVLEKLDAHGLVSADTHILDFFTKKQAVFAFSVREAEQQLVIKINEKLAASSSATPTA